MGGTWGRFLCFIFFISTSQYTTTSKKTIPTGELSLLTGELSVSTSKLIVFTSEIKRFWFSNCVIK